MICFQMKQEGNDAFVSLWDLSLSAFMYSPVWHRFFVEGKIHLYPTSSIPGMTRLGITKFNICNLVYVTLVNL